MPAMRCRNHEVLGELDRDDRIVAERLPQSAEFTPEERKKHRFCTRCWYEEIDSVSRSG